MATQRDLEEINRQYPSGPDGPRIDDAIGFVRAHPWGRGKDEKPQVAWPKRDFYDSDESYIISMLKQLFVELANLRVPKTPIPARPNTYVGGAAPLVPRTVTLSLTAEDWDEISRISWKRLVNDEILLSLMVSSRLAGDRAEAR